MSSWMADVWVGFAMLIGIAFFGVLVWALIYTVVNMFREEKRNGKRN